MQRDFTKGEKSKLTEDPELYPDTKPKPFRITPLMQQMIDDMVFAGLYLNDSEALRAAVLLLHEQKQPYFKKGAE